MHFSQNISDNFRKCCSQHFRGYIKGRDVKILQKNRIEKTIDNKGMSRTPYMTIL